MSYSKVTGNSSSESKNGRARGAGIYLNNTNKVNSENFSALIKHSEICDNKVGWADLASNSKDKVYDLSAGGGIHVIGTLDIDQSVIAGNRALCGGGIMLRGGNLNISGSKIQSNTAVGIGKFTDEGYGGGIFNLGGKLTLYGTTIGGDRAELGNIALTSGGGIYGMDRKYKKDGKDVTDGTGYLLDSKISNNSAKLSGGGLYLMRSNTTDSLPLPYYMTNLTITENHTDGSGGGIYIQGASKIENGISFYTVPVYITETEPENFKLKDNVAAEGGGIYTILSPIYMDIEGPIQNTATSQGNNLYLTHSDNWIVDGDFLHPQLQNATGIYNIYMDINSVQSGEPLYLDPSEVTISKREKEGNADAIFLKTASSYFSFLQKPEGTAGSFPIDIDKDNFKVGSIVVKPANVNESVEFFKVNNEAKEATSYTHLYTERYENAGEDAGYLKAGVLPRRTQLGGFNSNIVLVGEGVYLSSNGDDDNNEGTSPDDAVATFEMAKTKLKERIEETSKKADNEGYSPFIYICGTVKVDKIEEPWELDYDDDDFSSAEGKINHNYAIAEEKAEGKAEPAQIRRFASFVDAPMIVVGDPDNENNTTKFTTGKIIVNGMAEAVVASDQGGNSPILKVEKGASAALNEGTRITNNYYGAVDVYGELTLDGNENANANANQQLYNNDGYYVRLYDNAKLYMNGHSRIIASGGATRRGSQDLIGVFSNSPGAEVHMQGSSSIVNVDGNAALLSAGIYLLGADSKVTMTGSSSLEGLNAASIEHNKYTTATQATYSNTNVGNISINTAGIRVGSGGEVLLEGTAEDWEESKVPRITGITSGYAISTDEDSSVTINNAVLEYNANNSSGYGIFVDNRNSVSKAASPHLQLLNHAFIKNARIGILTDGKQLDVQMQQDSKIENSGLYGVYLSSNSSGEFSMNKAEDEDANPLIVGNQIGIYTQTEMEMNIYMGTGSSIRGLLPSSGTSKGIEVNSKKTDGTGPNITMNNSTISGLGSGINLYYAYRPTSITMNGKSALEGNQYGLSEDGDVNDGGGMYSKLIMNDDSRISGNSKYGIYLAGRAKFENDVNRITKITLNNNAIIGGSRSYDAKDLESGNSNAGIWSVTPIEFLMNHDSRVSGNGGYAIYLSNDRTNNNRRLPSSLTLKGESSICGNDGRIYIYDEISCKLTIESGASIENNKEAVYMKGKDKTIELKGKARLGGVITETSEPPETPETPKAEPLALDTYGTLILDGESTISGEIRLRTGTLPIIMTAKVPENSNNEYKLWLAEEYLGQIVVTPDGTNVTDVEDQLKYFNKTGGAGLAADRLLIAESPNIVLQAGNNVYLSGAGKDSNSGLSPAHPVRTFTEAKRLLTTGPFTTGANIIICGSVVEVLRDDADWSFENGTVTNHNVTWSPVITRYENYAGQMVGINGNSSLNAKEVTFKNITIDGGSQEGIVLNTSAELLKIVNGKAILGEKAVLQNNEYKDGTYSSAGIDMEKGTLEIDGGTIRNIVKTYINQIGNGGLASVIWMRSGSTLIMKSGLIANNELNCPSVSSANARLGIIYMDGATNKMVMSGGVIENNKITNLESLTVLKSPPRTGTLLTYDATITIEGGIIRNNQTSYRGSAIYYYNTSAASTGSLVVSGGLIGNNTPSASDQKPEDENSPIYIEGNKFQLKGGGAKITDNIYLSSPKNLVTISDAMYQKGRLYHIFLNIKNSDFQKGSVIVQPDGNYVTDATPYNQYFQVHSYPYILDMGRTDTLAGTIEGIKEKQCLLLIKAVYLDSEKGSDSNEGTRPDQAVETFSQAIQNGESGKGDKNHYVIYLSGPAINKNKETWTLQQPAYMCRYTGFPVYTGEGNNMMSGNAYHNVLIKPKADLTLNNISIYGRRSWDPENLCNGESIIKIPSGVTVTVQENTELQRNNNNGSYVVGDIGTRETVRLSGKGGAVFVDPGGMLEIYGGIIQDTDAIDGSAIYLNIDEKNKTAGRLFVTGSPYVAGKTYLNGKGEAVEAYVETNLAFKPVSLSNKESTFHISVGNDYSGRKLIQYTDGEPGYDQIKKFSFDDSIKAIYDFVNNSGNNRIIELSIRTVIYLDGQIKEPDSSRDGKTPATALTSLEEVYRMIGDNKANKGFLVYVVDTVNIKAGAEVTLLNAQVNEGNSSHYEGVYEYKKNAENTVKITGQVYFKRYSQPESSDPDFNAKDTLKDTLFYVEDGGKLTLNGIYIDGHSEKSLGGKETLIAEGVNAYAPLITVEGGGELVCSTYDQESKIIKNGTGVNTILINNSNEKDKEKDILYLIGELNDSPIYEGSSAGIEILTKDGKQAKVNITSGEFRNLQLKEGVAGGSDLYVNGEVHLNNKTILTGTVFLEGVGTKDSIETSRFITVDLYGDPVVDNFQLLMRDPYLGRTVVKYLSEMSPEPKDIAKFLLEDRVKDYFCLLNRANDKFVLELNVPAAVYINGIKGEDSQSGDAAGSNPDHPIQSLRRAYELLHTRGGGTIYVVDTIKEDANIVVTGSEYTDDSGLPSIYLSGTSKVRITRYIQPDFARNASTPEEIMDVEDRGYKQKDFTGVLLNVIKKAEFSEGIYFDGHREPKEGENYREEAVVSVKSTANSPMITVEKGAELYLNEGTVLQDNYNTYGKEETDTKGSYGGAIYNSGTTTVDGAYFVNNTAEKGAVVYQDGIFTIESAPDNLQNKLLNPNNSDKEPPVNDNFYLTTEDGTDHVIQLNENIKEDQDYLLYDIDMDNPVAGRDVIEFISDAVIKGSSDAEHDHFRLSDNIPKNLFLVEASDNPNILELQDWQVLNVEVPSDIYLVFRQSGKSGDTKQLKSIRTEAVGDKMFSSPEYTITNRGIYDVKVSVTAFENVSADAGITDYSMNLVDTENEATGEDDLYLAVKGLEQTSGEGFSFDETALASYAAAEGSRPAALEFGLLNPSETGSFTFLGTVGEGFINKYSDWGILLIEEKEDVQKYIDGTSGSGDGVKARAKYSLKFKLEIDPPRRESTEGGANP